MIVVDKVETMINFRPGYSKYLSIPQQIKPDEDKLTKFEFVKHGDDIPQTYVTR